jgi:hypothetical protein
LALEKRKNEETDPNVLDDPLYELIEMQNYFYELDKKRKQKLGKDLEPKLPTSYQKLKQSSIRLSKYDYGDKKGKKVKFKGTLSRTNVIYDPDNDNQGIDNFLIIITQHPEIPDHIAERAKFILAKTWNEHQKDKFNQIHMEIAALACVMYCCSKYSSRNITVDFKEIIKVMYPKHETGYRFKKLITAYKAVCELSNVETNILQEPKISKGRKVEYRDFEVDRLFNRIVCTSDCLVKLTNPC